MPKSLSEYRRKRTFERTPEPDAAAASTPSSPKVLRFYIQRHSARRLHYDLRLEMDGVLRSWAVPKGPTLDPEEKRLAVLVEDHPLEYGEFEGTIPAGNYGAGTVMVWDKGSYEWLSERSPAEQWERGDLKLRLHGQKVMGEFALVRTKRGKGNEWLLIKKKDFAARPGWNAEDDLRSVREAGGDPAQLPGAVRAEMPRKLTPMLACIAETLPEGAEWVYEVKWDGVRALCFLEEGKLRLLSRSGNPTDVQYPDLAPLVDAVAAQSAILDGEIVALDEQGRPSFSLLQPRMMARARSAAQLARGQPVTLFAFDLLYLNGYDLRQAPLIERKRLLESIIAPGPLVRYSDHFTGSGRELLEAARRNGLEGVVAKRALSRYESRRSPEWLKIKVVSQQEFVICGYTEGEREGFGALVLGYFDEGRLLWAGNVGSGFDQKLLRSMRAALGPLETSGSPIRPVPAEIKEVRWVRPELVCTVKFTSWTNDKRLRAPVFLGLRPDILPKDVLREAGTAQPASLDAPQGAAPLLPAKQAEVFLTVDGRRLKFTNLNKVYWPREGYTKRDLINYYDAVAGLILPHLRERALSLRRYPDGIAGESFFQKEAGPHIAPWVRRVPIPSEERAAAINFVVADDRATLLYLANLGCIDHNPWMSRIGTLDHPDFILIDLDPVDCGFDRIIEAARLVRSKLELLDLAGYPKTTGGDGLHVYIPLEPRYSYAQARSFAEIMACLCTHDRPDLFTTPRSVEKREKGRVYFDYLQISSGKTISAPYVLRAHPGAPVATPLAWNEVKGGLTPAQFHLGNVLDRFARLGDIFQPVLTQPQRLEPALEKMGELLRH